MITVDTQKLETDAMIANNDPYLQADVKKTDSTQPESKEHEDVQENSELKELETAQKKSEAPFDEIKEIQEIAPENQEPPKPPISKEEAMDSAMLAMGMYNMMIPALIAPTVEVDTAELKLILEDAGLATEKPIEHFEQLNQQIRATIALSPQEMDALKSDLGAVMQESNMKLTPKQSLVMGIAVLAFTKYQAVQTISKMQQKSFNELKRAIGNNQLEKPKKARFLGGLRDKLSVLSFFFGGRAKVQA